MRPGKRIASLREVRFSAMPLASVLSNADPSKSLALHVGIPIGNADGLDLQAFLAGVERLDTQRLDIAAIQVQHRDW